MQSNQLSNDLLNTIDFDFYQSLQTITDYHQYFLENFNSIMDLPYQNSYHYNHEWSIPTTTTTTTDNHPLYPTPNPPTNCYNIPSCSAAPHPSLPPPHSSSYYSDYYTASNCYPSTIPSCSTPYNTYPAFNHHETNQFAASSSSSSSHSNHVSTSSLE